MLAGTSHLSIVADPGCTLTSEASSGRARHPATNQKWFTEHNGDLYVLTWPSNSTDLNLVVHVWDVLISGGCLSQLKWGAPMTIIGLVFVLVFHLSDQGWQMLHDLTSYESTLWLKS